MSTTGSRSHLAIALQPAKIGDGVFNPGSLTWWKHRMTQIDFGVDQIQQSLPLETGGPLFPDGSYKAGAFLSGSVAMEPRLQSAIGYYLYAVTGGHTASASAAARGVVNRYFADPTDETKLPWIATRRYLPGSTGSNGITDYGIDCRMGSLAFTMPGYGTMKAEASIIGRKPNSVDSESNSGNTYDHPIGQPLSCKTSVKIGNSGLPINIQSTADAAFTAAQVIVSNNLSSPTDEMVLGSYYPEDFTTLSRVVQIRLVYKWNSDALYKAFLYTLGGSYQADWSPEVMYAPIEITADSQANIGAPYTHPYRLVFRSPNVSWQIAKPRSIAGQLLQTELIGTVHEPAAGNPFEFDLWNLHTMAIP